jgi:hypothetical protein
VSAALAALLQRTNDDCFVILKEQQTGKFVQFATGHSGLLLDLPAVALDKNEWGRAEHYFLDEHGVTPYTSEQYSDAAMTISTGLWMTIYMELRQDVRKATRIALDVFDQVYLLPLDFQLMIEEN